MMLFSLDSPERIPEGYEDLLPRPWEEVAAELENGERVALYGKARDVRTTLLAAPTREELGPVIRKMASLNRH
ncbi:MAG: hypothetical protein GY851_18685 [bacterium]|nr:hypothetical protein [bacterium]